MRSHQIRLVSFGLVEHKKKRAAAKQRKREKKKPAKAKQTTKRREEEREEKGRAIVSFSFSFASYSSSRGALPLEVRESSSLASDTTLESASSSRNANFAEKDNLRVFLEGRRTCDSSFLEILND